MTRMTDRPEPCDPPKKRLAALPKDHIDVQLDCWVSACLDNRVLDLNQMIETAPPAMRTVYPCYGSMADAIEVSVQRLWWDMALTRMGETQG